MVTELRKITCWLYCVNFPDNRFIGVRWTIKKIVTLNAKLNFKTLGWRVKWHQKNVHKFPYIPKEKSLL